MDQVGDDVRSVGQEDQPRTTSATWPSPARRAFPAPRSQRDGERDPGEEQVPDQINMAGTPTIRGRTPRAAPDRTPSRARGRPTPPGVHVRAERSTGQRNRPPPKCPKAPGVVSRRGPAPSSRGSLVRASGRTLRPAGEAEAARRRGSGRAGRPVRCCGRRPARPARGRVASARPPDRCRAPRGATMTSKTIANVTVSVNALANATRRSSSSISPITTSLLATIRADCSTVRSAAHHVERYSATSCGSRSSPISDTSVICPAYRGRRYGSSVHGPSHGKALRRRARYPGSGRGRRRFGMAAGRCRRLVVRRVRCDRHRPSVNHLRIVRTDGTIAGPSA